MFLDAIQDVYCTICAMEERDKHKTEWRMGNLPHCEFLMH
jgi:hypothetical protein